MSDVTNTPNDDETVTTETVTTETDTEPAADTAAEDAGPDVGQAEVQDKMDEATDKGYFGDKVDPLPNEAHSLESGPDAPSPAPDDRTRA